MPKKFDLKGDSKMAELGTIKQTAERAASEDLGVTETALRSWIAEGRLPVVAVGNRKMVYWPTLMQFLEQGQTVDNSPLPYRKRGYRR